MIHLANPSTNVVLVSALDGAGDLVTVWTVAPGAVYVLPPSGIAFVSASVSGGSSTSTVELSALQSVWVVGGSDPPTVAIGLSDSYVFGFGFAVVLVSGLIRWAISVFARASKGHVSIEE